MIVQSRGSLAAFTDARSGPLAAQASTVALYNHGASYADIYATQPYVRTCVEFLAQGIAELVLHVFRRVSDIDRVRLPEHDLVRWLAHPNPFTTRYGLMEALVSDLAIYMNAYWLKIRFLDQTGRKDLALVRLPASEVQVFGGLLPAFYRWTRHGHQQDFAPVDVVRFSGYNPVDPLTGLSPIETLRSTLEQDAAATQHRADYWRHASRMDGFIERPLAAPKWTKEQRLAFITQWQERYVGAPSVGQSPVLEEGMTFKPSAFSPRDSEYVASRKLTREECAGAWHIPPPFIGDLEHATYSNIKEQHKQLYQDTLGPWLRKLKEGIEQQLLPEAQDTANVYTDFNIAAKLAGSFEEQAQSLQMAVGRPWMTANEARARVNLPQSPDPSANMLAAQQGGPAGTPPAQTAPEYSDFEGDARVVPVLHEARRRQLARLEKVPAAVRHMQFLADIHRWNAELVADLEPLIGSDAALTRAHAANLAMLVELHRESDPAPEGTS